MGEAVFTTWISDRCWVLTNVHCTSEPVATPPSTTSRLASVTVAEGVVPVFSAVPVIRFVQSTLLRTKPVLIASVIVTFVVAPPPKPLIVVLTVAEPPEVVRLIGLAGDSDVPAAELVSVKENVPSPPTVFLTITMRGLRTLLNVQVTSAPETRVMVAVPTGEPFGAALLMVVGNVLPLAVPAARRQFSAGVAYRW